MLISLICNTKCLLLMWNLNMWRKHGDPTRTHKLDPDGNRLELSAGVSFMQNSDLNAFTARPVVCEAQNHLHVQSICPMLYSTKTTRSKHLNCDQAGFSWKQRALWSSTDLRSQATSAPSRTGCDSDAVNHGRNLNPHKTCFSASRRRKIYERCTTIPSLLW